MDATDAYKKKEMKGWRRHIVLDKPVITLIVDEVKSAAGAEIEARFHSAVETDLKDKCVLLKGEQGLMALFPIVDSDFTFRPGKHANLPVKKDLKFEWIPYFGTVFQARDNNSVFATLVMPVKDENEAMAIAESVEKKIDKNGDMMLSFSQNGEVHSYLFKKEKSGFLLSD